MKSFFKDFSKQFEEYKKANQKVERKMVFSKVASQLQDNEDFVSFGKFLSMVRYNHPELVKTAMSTTSAQGGYTIPNAYSDIILGALNNVATAFGKCTKVNMSAPSLYYPASLTDLTTTYSTEATAKDVTKPTFAQRTLSLRYFYALVTMTKELFADSICDLEGYLEKLVGENIGLKLDAQVLQGNSDPFIGIVNAEGTNAVAQAAANLAYSDLTAVVNNTGQLEQYKRGAGWWLTRGALNLIMNLKDANNRPIWELNNPLKGMESTILGYPINITDQITDTISSAGSTTIVFGDLQHVFIGKKQGDPDGLDVLFNETGIISSSTAVTENLYQQNEVSWRFEMRRGVLVAVPAAFVKLTTVK